MTDKDFIKGFHSIPDESALKRLSFEELSALIIEANDKSPAFMVIDREVKRRIAQDQAIINRKNVCVGAVMGGMFSLLGVVLGWWLRAAVTYPSHQPTNSSAVQEHRQSQVGTEHKVVVKKINHSPNPVPVTSSPRELIVHGEGKPSPEPATGHEQ